MITNLASITSTLDKSMGTYDKHLRGSLANVETLTGALAKNQDKIANAITLTVLTPVSHGDGVEGNVTMAKRVTVITGDGPKQVPHLSANALRGVLRRHGAERMFAMLNVEPGEVPPAAVYAAANGGSLQATKKPLSTRDVHDLRQAVPHLGLFGCSGGGQIIPGSLIVDMPLLRCVERGNSPLSGDKQLVE